MANNSLSYFSLVINRQIDTHEKISEYLLRAEAMANVASCCRDFADLDAEIISNYMWTIREIIYQAAKLQSKQLEELVTIKPENHE